VVRRIGFDQRHVYFRGQPRDFDDGHARQSGLGYSDVFAVLIRSESNDDYDCRITERRADSGQSHPQAEPDVPAFSGSDALLGFAPATTSTAEPGRLRSRQGTIRDGRRDSTAVAYLRPARTRGNLEVLHPLAGDAHRHRERRADRDRVATRRRHTAAAPPVAKLLFAPEPFSRPTSCCCPVSVTRSAARSRNRRSSTPLPGVGANYHDHLAAGILMEMSNSESYGISLKAAPRGAWNLFQYALFRTGRWRATFFEANAFVRSAADLDRPDLQIVFQPARRNAGTFPFPLGHGFALSRGPSVSEKPRYANAREP